MSPLQQAQNHWKSQAHSRLYLPPLNCSIRKIADMLSADGYYTIVPKILNPCMDGSEEGDGEREK